MIRTISGNLSSSLGAGKSVSMSARQRRHDGDLGERAWLFIVGKSVHLVLLFQEGITQAGGQDPVEPFHPVSVLRVVIREQVSQIRVRAAAA
jgi:hypothetical protein